MYRVFIDLLSIEILDLLSSGTGHGIHPGHATPREWLHVDKMLNILVSAAISLMLVGHFVYASKSSVYEKGPFTLFKFNISHRNLWGWKFGVSRWV